MIEGSSVSTSHQGLRSWLFSSVVVLLAPTLSVLVAFPGPSAQYWEFPPRKQFIEHAPFSLAAWTFYATIGVALSIIFLCSLSIRIRLSGRISFRSAIAATLLCCAWGIAWTREPWAASIQNHTFLLLWISYIALVIAFLRDLHGQFAFFRPARRFLLVFPISAAFWWIFEFLNRFIQNWRYQNVDQYSAGEYFVLATLSFSTVLPSIWVTSELLKRTFITTRWNSRFVAISPPIATASVLLSIAALALLPIYPDLLFPSVWIVPIVLVVAFESLAGRTILPLASWPIWAASGLWCGVLWELWNMGSQARWIYDIPYVHRFTIFEMPIVGYAGYLPFGVLCGMAIESIRGVVHDQKHDL